MVATRRSRRVNIQDGGLPLPAGLADSYGENNELPPAKDGNRQATNEDDNNIRNNEFYNETFSLSRDRRQSSQISERQQSQPTQQGQKDPQGSDPITEAINNINKPVRPSQGPWGSTSGKSQSTFISHGPSRPIFPETHRLYLDDDDPWNLRDEPGNRNLYPTGLQNPYQTPSNGKRHPSEPANSLASKWGMAGGRPSPYPLSTRSFIHEERLYGSADVNSPSIPPPPRHPAPQRTQPGGPTMQSNGNPGSSPPAATPAARPNTSNNNAVHPAKPVTNNNGTAFSTRSATGNTDTESHGTGLTNVDVDQDPSTASTTTKGPINSGQSKNNNKHTISESARSSASETEQDTLGASDRVQPAAGRRTQSTHPISNQQSLGLSTSIVNGSSRANNQQSSNNPDTSKSNSKPRQDRNQIETTATSRNGDNSRLDTATKTTGTDSRDGRQGLVSTDSGNPDGSGDHDTVTNDGFTQVWMDNQSVGQLGSRIGVADPILKKVSRPWTGRDELTPLQDDSADHIRQKFRLDKESTGAAPDRLKPVPPTYPSAQSEDSGRAAASHDDSITSGNQYDSPSSGQRPPPNGRTRDGLESNQQFIATDSQNKSQHGIQQPAPTGSKPASSVSHPNSRSTTTESRSTTGTQINNQTGSRNNSARSEDTSQREPSQLPQNSMGNRNTTNSHVAPARTLPSVGQSWMSRVLMRAQEFGTSFWNIFRKFWFLPLFLLLTALLLAKLGDSDAWSPGSGSFSEWTMPTPRLPNWGGCCANSKLKEIFTRLDEIDLDLNMIHGNLATFVPGYKRANDGRQVFWVEKTKDGKLVIPQDYYEAIKQQILKDKDLLKGVSNTTWAPVINRLVADGYLQNKPAAFQLGLDDITSEGINNAWNLWIRQNDAAIIKALNGELEKTMHELTEKELKDLLTRRNIDLTGGKLLTQKDFEDLYKKEVKGNYSEKLRELADQVEEYKNGLEKFKAKPPHGISKEELDKVVDAAVKKYTDALKIEAAAKSGSIAMLGRLTSQINYFTKGSGAVIDPHFTSLRWVPPKKSFQSKQWYDQDGYKPNPALTAILPWDSEGDCFCAGPNIRGHGAGTANISIMISRDVVPEVVVLEHILPGATLDPGARPRDVEIWAQYEDYHLRQTVEAWSRARWPGTIAETTLPENFVKIDDFTYEDHKVGDGAQVHKINSELAEMDAASSVYVVRALNNYGADHTCFYRIRLYGKQRDRDLGN